MYPYQQEILNCTNRLRLIVKGRQIGISQVIAGEAVYEAKYTPESKTVFISRNGDEAKELIHYCRIIASEDPDLGVLRGAQELRIPSYHRITCEPAVTGERFRIYARILAEAASPSAGRGGGKRRLYLDEFAHGNFRHWGPQIWQSVRPAISLGGGLTIVSTPKRKDNMFYRLYLEAIRGLNTFQVFKIPWHDCPMFNPKGFHLQDPAQRKAIGEAGKWFHAERPGYTDAEWAEEYDCDFASSAGLVFSEFDEQASVGDFPYNPLWPSYAGQDFGYVNPSVAIIVQTSPSEDVFVIAEDYRTRRTLADLGKNVYRQLKDKYKVGHWWCDPSSPGEIKDLVAAGLPAKPCPKHSVEDSVNFLRKLMKPPGGGPTKLHIDRSCRQLATDLGTWANKPEKDEPEKDLNDHGPDALRYYAWAWSRRAVTGNVFTFGGRNVSIAYAS